VADVRWEYDYLEEPPRLLTDLVDDLNARGAEGWEAFAVVPIGRSTNSVVVLLKRPVEGHRR
jgi:hypothetical protein